LICEGSILRAADAVCRRRLARARGRVIGVLVAIHLPGVCPCVRCVGLFRSYGHPRVVHSARAAKSAGSVESDVQIPGAAGTRVSNQKKLLIRERAHARAREQSKEAFQKRESERARGKESQSDSNCLLVATNGSEGERMPRQSTGGSAQS
jgi:hypothetical protein